MPDRRRGPLVESRRLINRLRNRGPREVIDLGASRLRETIYSSQAIVLYARLAEAVPASAVGLEARAATETDAHRYARDIGTDSPDTFRARLAPDVTCFVVEGEGRLLHASWVTTTAAWTREIRGYLSPPHGDAYVYESYTRDDARGRGIYPLALAGLLNLAATGGQHRLWVAVERSNAASSRAVSKAGFEAVFSIRYRRLLGTFRSEPAASHEPEREGFLRYGKRLPAPGV